MLVLNTCHNISLTLPKRQILESSKLKEFADNNFKFDKSVAKFSEWVENTVGKGEVARFELVLERAKEILTNTSLTSFPNKKF